MELRSDTKYAIYLRQALVGAEGGSARGGRGGRASAAPLCCWWCPITTRRLRHNPERRQPRAPPVDRSARPSGYRPPSRPSKPFADPMKGY
ncbi:hypothetical protein EVAR_37113_1 [Eumeta japonica]|uniref:Uncharacterized protein n=1 Tax=Eumeta variegata TaxID=151549 RepID=A0A4C1XST2_EUMVA|nr:hypothetical protein EVAR_37113_1 [Eumeta japonica]